VVWSGGRDGEPGFKEKEKKNKRTATAREIGGVDKVDQQNMGRADHGPAAFTPSVHKMT
jgi:hypothetical protein